MGVPDHNGYQAIFRFFLASKALSNVACLLAARFENPRVGGSIPPQATKILRSARSIDFAGQQKKTSSRGLFSFLRGLSTPRRLPVRRADQRSAAQCRSDKKYTKAS
ncbi:hypothetical protein [Ralstonia mannitolilytica]|uniref:hypothetical protein n=1 Tax=Ralstonia mannitolilytica TaxID=105219 RepID=UPI00292CACE6|nr:hypothetical protein [Ralstonia mannitolilytica]